LFLTDFHGFIHPLHKRALDARACTRCKRVH